MHAHESRFLFFLLMISLHELRMTTSEKELFRDLSLVLNTGDRLAIVGQNGCGKSTLLRVIAGLERPDSGSVDRTGEQMLLAEQQINSYSLTLNEYLELVDYPETWRFLSELNLLDLPIDTPIESLSGGQRTKLILARCFAQPSTTLLLDEPTNHLDSETRAWLVDRIRAYRGIIVLVSHDRAFLNQVATHILEIDAANHRTALFHGNYDAYKKEKAAWREREQEAYDLQQRRKREMEEWLVLKRQEASVHPNPAKGRLIRQMEHRLEREILAQAVHRPRKEKEIAGARFFGSIHTDKLMLRLANVQKSYDGREIIKDASCEIRGPERVRIRGGNGAGKTTLLRLIMNEIAPDHGTVEVGNSIRIGYFSQHLESLNEGDTVFDAFASKLRDRPSESRIRATLGAFLFTGDSIYKTIRHLSYGERVRLQLAILLQQEYQLLVLDEVTNHLDIPSREAIENALNEYEGALIIVSHDDYFVQQIGVQTELVLNDGVLTTKQLATR